MYFDFVIPQRPVSLQTRKTANLQAWKHYVRGEAEKAWGGQIFVEQDIQLTLVYLYKSNPVDTDNIIKPIQDALIGLVYEDDSLITDVSSHRRSLFGTFDVTLCPSPLVRGIVLGVECVYVRVSESQPLEGYL
jgi:crossover junction endodeoxyribonuclease RusA